MLRREAGESVGLPKASLKVRDRGPHHLGHYVSSSPGSEGRGGESTQCQKCLTT